MRDELCMTSVIVSHHVQSVFRISDRIAMMNQGRFILVGTPLDYRQSEDEMVRQFIHGKAEGPLSDVELGD